MPIVSVSMSLSFVLRLINRGPIVFPEVRGGRHYCLNRNNTFWEYSRGFWDYQSRSAYVMRQGRPVIDLAVYLGENAPVKVLTYRLPDIPSGYDFDAFTSDALFSRMESSKR